MHLAKSKPKTGKRMKMPAVRAWQSINRKNADTDQKGFTNIVNIYIYNIPYTNPNL